MRWLLIIVAVLGLNLPAAAQAPLLDCATTYDCCIKRKGAAHCAPQQEGIIQAAEDAVNVIRVGSAATPDESTATLANAIDGETVNSQLVHSAEHLALILELKEVGGVPPSKPPKEETNKHWWREVKTAVRTIHRELKNCRSRRQLFAALGKARNRAPRTPEQVADIEARLIEAAKKMGESVEELIPCR